MKILSFIIVIISFIFFSACIAAALYPFFKKKEEEAEIPFPPLACPATGSFIGWKCAVDESNHYVLIKLEIPEDAKRTSGLNSKKCRCDKAKVLEIRNFTGELKEAHSIYDSTFVYKVGEEVFVKDFCNDRMRICAPGIHFFMERTYALDYYGILYLSYF
jgi:hypothetical protein